MGCEGKSMPFFKVYIFLKPHAYGNFANIGQRTLNRLKITCWHELVCGYVSVRVLQRHALHNYNTTTKPKTLISLHYYRLILRPHSSFARCPNNVFYNERIQSRITCRIQWSYPFFFFNLECFLSVLDFHDLESPVL